LGEPVLMKLFTKFNTAIPTSAADECQFSIGKDRAKRATPCQMPTLRSRCSWRGTTITLRQWRRSRRTSHNEWIKYAISIEQESQQISGGT